ncbi:MAG: hypothetical protein RL266_1731 [Bacteroidota bacterium]
MIHTENLIVGLGIAGLNLCHYLEKAGKSFLVIDRCPANSSSLIAGGIYNPIALKRKLKSWKVDELFQNLVETYSEIDQRLGISSLEHNFPILKPISALDDLHEWERAVDENRLSPYVNSLQVGTPTGPFSENTIASVTIEHAGFVRIGKTLMAYREYLKNSGRLLTGDFDHDGLEIDGDAIRYQDLHADRVIFAEGRFIRENPYFNWLPFRGTKGQMLTVKVPDSLTPDRIYNQQFLLFPTEEKNIFRLGATYEWTHLDEIPTQEATAELVAKVESALSIKLEVMDAQAAVRPTVIDRRPVVGKHPNKLPLFIFNGLGTKGVMLAPYFAKQLVDHIYDGKPLDQEVHLNRFVQKHYVKD